MYEMTCATVADRDIVERYLTDGLADEERDRFEAHLFECDRCLEWLRAADAVRAELDHGTATRFSPRPMAPARWRGWWLAGGALAAALAIVLVAALGRSGPAPSTAGPAPRAAAAAPAHGPSREVLTALARIEPPPYAPMTVRGEAATPSDFDRGMEAYRRGTIRTPCAGLKRAPPRRTRPGDALLPRHVPADGRRCRVGGPISLRAAVDLGESPYQQQAEVFLSKALIRIGDLDGAEREADRASRLGGDRAADAHRSRERAAGRPRRLPLTSHAADHAMPDRRAAGTHPGSPDGCSAAAVARLASARRLSPVRRRSARRGRAGSSTRRWRRRARPTPPRPKPRRIADGA